MAGTSDKQPLSEDGFTLIELLVVIIIIAILAAIAIPTYMGQRERANDTAAYSLVRNGLTMIQTAFADTGDYTKIDAGMLNAIDYSMTWSDNGADLVDTSLPGITPVAGVPADAGDDEIAFFCESASVVDLASRSGSGNWFGIQIDCQNIANTGYVEVKMIDGEAQVGW